MKRVELLVLPAKFDEVKDALLEIGVDTMTLNEVKYVNPGSRRREVFRGSAYAVDFVLKVRMELVVEDAVIPQVLNAVKKALEGPRAHVTRIVVSEVSEVLQIETHGRAERKRIGLPAPVHVAVAKQCRALRLCPAS